MKPDWLTVRRADTPLILAMPHGGTELPDKIANVFRSRWLARRDADWHIGELYDGLADATVVATPISRSVIDVNRDPSGASLYPGQATTELCPTTTFDGEPLYEDGLKPRGVAIAARRTLWFDPYHAALSDEVSRLRAKHDNIIVFDCHSIRSRIPRLFEGELPIFNIGSNGGETCDPELRDKVALICKGSKLSCVVDGRFRGGWTTRHYGNPSEGVHAIQMELAMRSYLQEPDGTPTAPDWPPAFDPVRAAPLRSTLAGILETCLEFAR